MSAVPAGEPPIVQEKMRRVGLRLVTTGEDLRDDAEPTASGTELRKPDPVHLRERLEQVARELAEITAEVRLLIYLSTIDEEDMQREADAFLERLQRATEPTEAATESWLGDLEARFG